MKVRGVDVANVVAGDAGLGGERYMSGVGSRATRYDGDADRTEPRNHRIDRQDDGRVFTCSGQAHIPDFSPDGVHALAASARSAVRVSRPAHRRVALPQLHDLTPIGSGVRTFSRCERAGLRKFLSAVTLRFAA